jgi:hypothetical protein
MIRSCYLQWSCRLILDSGEISKSGMLSGFWAVGPQNRRPRGCRRLLVGTPASALAPLLPYLQKVWKIWEPAMGEGRPVAGLREQGYQAEGSDIKTGDDFLLSQRGCDVIVTNPPYSRKQEFLERCYALGKPFALLLPLTALETEERQQLFREHGIEIILLSKRITFETPHKRNSSPR